MSDDGVRFEMLSLTDRLRAFALDPEMADDDRSLCLDAASKIERLERLVAAGSAIVHLFRQAHGGQCTPPTGVPMSAWCTYCDRLGQYDWAHSKAVAEAEA